MFQLFLRARAHNYLKAPLEDQNFKARAADRDAETDRARVLAPFWTRSKVRCMRRNRSNPAFTGGLGDVLARAAVTTHGTKWPDEYLEREALDSHHQQQDLFRQEIL